MQTISLNTLPRYLPLIEASNESRLSKLPNLLQILKNSQLALAHESTAKAHLVSDNKTITKSATNLVSLVQETKQKPKDFERKLESYKEFLDATETHTDGVVTLSSKDDPSNIATRIREYIAKFDAFMKKMDTELSNKSLGELFLRDRTAFNQAKENFVKENAELMKEGEQWLKLLQDLICSYKGRKQRSQENRRLLQDKLLQALNILPLQVQLTEALFEQISTFKTHTIATGVFQGKMTQFSEDIRAIYTSSDAMDFIALKGNKEEYLKKYQGFIKDAEATRAKLADIQKGMPEIPTHRAIAIHLDTLFMNDTSIEAETKKISADLISRIVEVYETSRNEMVTAQAKVDTHIESLLKHRIDRLLNGIDWQDFSRITWKRSVLHWTRYSEIK